MKEYVEAYGFETALPTYTQIPSGIGNLTRDKLDRVYKAITVNIGNATFDVLDSAWEKECQSCGGIGRAPFSQWNPRETYCFSCNGTGYVEPYEVAMTFVRIPSRKWEVRLFSDKKDVDCGEIAKSFGGSGTKCAGVFVCDELPFEH